MAFQVSPGVLVQEKDLTTIIPNVSTSIGGIVIAADKGPCDDIVEVSTEKQLVDIFGTPSDINASSWYTAANFLKYSGALKVVRAIDETVAKNASGTAGVLIKNDNIWENATPTAVGNFAAKSPGLWGNSLKVSVCPSEGGLIQTVSIDAGGTGYTDGTYLVSVGNGNNGVIELIVTSGVIVTATIDTIGSGYSASTATFNLTALGAGTGGAVSITADTLIFANWVYADLFDSGPGTTNYATDVGGSNDELYIVVIDEDGGITGVANTVLEIFIVSKGIDAKSVTGESMYYKDKLFRSSNYIYWMDHQSPAGSYPAFGGSVKGVVYDPTAVVYDLSLAHGLDGVYPTSGDFKEGLDKFNDADTIDVNLIMAGPADMVHAQNVVNLCTARKDVLGFISPEMTDVVGVVSSDTQTTNVKAYFDLLTSTSYVSFDSGWKYQYDTYNDVYRWVPLNGDIAGCCANTDDVADPWFSPAGMSRGNIKSVVKLAYNPKKNERDTLYKARINPVVTFPGMGTLLWGDKTAQAKASAFDRINVRRLFMVLEKAISRASKAQLFELNDDITRNNFIAMTEPFLRDVQGRRGITDFKVVCDISNNTGDVIDRNEFRADIYIKPARSINFITLTFVATRTGVSFTEVGA
jgi:hypothetical protein